MAKKRSVQGGVITMTRSADDTEARAMARGVLRPTVGAAIAVQAVYGKAVGNELLDVSELMGELGEQCGKVHDGDLKRMESVLVAQAHTLDALFNRLTQRAMAQEYLKQFETYMRLALKAQAQARATVEALAEIKNPRPVAFVKQANVGTNVQVNNGPADQNARARRDVEHPQNELLGSDDGSTGMDTGAARTAGGGDPAMAAVDPINRADEQRG